MKRNHDQVHDSTDVDKRRYKCFFYDVRVLKLHKLESHRPSRITRNSNCTRMHMKKKKKKNWFQTHWTNHRDVLGQNCLWERTSLISSTGLCRCMQWTRDQREQIPQKTIMTNHRIGFEFEAHGQTSTKPADVFSTFLLLFLISWCSRDQ